MLGSVQMWVDTVLGWKKSPKRQVIVSVNTGTERNDLFMKIQQVLMPRFVVFFMAQSLRSVGNCCC